jgi:hypothetical protein
MRRRIEAGVDMPTLHNASSGALLGDISDDDARLLVDKLEEESDDDDDYFIDADTIDLLENAGASDALVALLKEAVSTSGGIDVRVEK